MVFGARALPQIFERYLRMFYASILLEDSKELFLHALRGFVRHGKPIGRVNDFGHVLGSPSIFPCISILVQDLPGKHLLLELRQFSIELGPSGGNLEIETVPQERRIVCDSQLVFFDASSTSQIKATHGTLGTTPVKSKESWDAFKP